MKLNKRLRIALVTSIMFLLGLAFGAWLIGLDVLLATNWSPAAVVSAMCLSLFISTLGAIYIDGKLYPTIDNSEQS